ncbi:hypothetical protein [Cellulomonas bogoriensis]|uniref:PH domain-containing protein n=1 Tax=Cellulomonas bogoriensis 69B4 = DSM 16987 TaxID=1386082 RepID=A0A0A0BWN8_9CELL|nr:hypothetical protein [Cellulomonas bogoriensis]KGM12107.1 hypothetical protein N869_00505 [Cellulomonas bogoriensis 69B4 = DSM 16987]
MAPFAALGGATFVAVLRGDPDPRAAMGALLLPGTLIGAALYAARTVRPRRLDFRHVRQTRAEESDLPGLALPYSRPVAVGGVVMLACLAASSLVLTVDGWARFGEDSRTIGAAFLAPIGIFAGVVLFGDIARGRIRRGAVILTARGIRHTSWSADAFVPWDAVVAVVPVTTPERAVRVVARPTPGAPPVTRRSRWWGQREVKFAPHLLISTLDVAAPPAVLLEVLDLYARYPALRAELGTAAAVRRFTPHA